MAYENYDIEKIYNGFAIVKAQEVGRNNDDEYEFLIYLPEDVKGARELQADDDFKDALAIILGEEYYYDWEAGTIEEAQQWIDCYDTNAE